MTQQFTDRLNLLNQPDNIRLLNHCLHGIERECLRVTETGALAATVHPSLLGSALMNPKITTDYAESLLEFITNAESATEQTLIDLKQTHIFTAQALANELLWSSSMPCHLPDEKYIKIAYYGTSLAGQVKHIYRRGLAVRYGKTMQCIAGIHYNFSFPEKLWPILQSFEKNSQALIDYQSNQYIALIRNFRRYSWLLMYLFGASPALDASFLNRYPQHKLQRFDEDTFYLPYATSLRMSDLGYHSNAQKGLTPCYDQLSTYIDSLNKAIKTPYPPYQEIGTKRLGEWIQLNTNVLQIENEYYSNIRPKRVTQPHERPIDALRRAGIQYVEVRCMDINPFLPMGIDESTSYFLNSFLVYCALQASPTLINGECDVCTNNFLATVTEGRNPQLMLQRNGSEILLTDWAKELLTDINRVAKLMDSACQTDKHSMAVLVQQAKVTNPNLLPSAQIISEMEEQQLSFAEFSLKQSQAHAAYFKKQSLATDVVASYQQIAKQSLQQQQQLEQENSQTIDDYIANTINS